MSQSHEIKAKAVSSNDSQSVSGFRSFWRKDKSAPLVTFVQQESTTQRKPNRISRIFKKSRPVSSRDDDDDELTGQNRRQQVYQAQKRHRNRKAEYVQSLEAEIAKLQHLDAVISREKNGLAHQNKAMKSFLASHSFDLQLDTMNMTSSISNELSQLGGAIIDIRFDHDVGYERTFLNLSDESNSNWTPQDQTLADERQQKRPVRHTPVTGDSVAALDFILALEWPCRAHIKHHTIDPEAKVPEACGVEKFHGHALTTTAAVYQSSLPPRTDQAESHPRGNRSTDQYGSRSRNPDKWQMPHSEIDKLVELSERLELDDESMTPAQAYSAIRQIVPVETYLRPTLEALKKPLASLMQCHGFGACMESAMFWQHLNSTIEDLQPPGLEV